MLENPRGLLHGNPLALYENQGIMSMQTWASFGTAAVATAVGLVVADFVDRVVATRQPADDGTTKAVRAWYGRDAAAAQRMRPDAWRLGAQAAGAVVGLALAFWTRNVKFVPWILGGVALGFASNLVMKITTWWLMPAVFKIAKPDEQTLANRTYVLEQSDTQDTVQGMFEKWASNPSLANQQLPEGTQIILGPLASSGPGGVYALGKGQANGSAAPGAVGSTAARFVNTGRLGLCPHCKQMNGCLSSCPTLCPKCPEYNTFVKAKYPVKAGDNLTQLAQLGGVSVSDVNAMNGGGSPESYWQVGKTVFVPYGMAMVIKDLEKRGSVGATPPAASPEPAAPPPAPAPAAAPQEVVAQPASFTVQNFGVQAESEVVAE